jgi:hypothetical protein
MGLLDAPAVSRRQLAASIPYNVLQPPGGLLYAAIGDGNSHHLSERFGNLAAAQVVFPRAWALTDEIDQAAIQRAKDVASWVYIPDTPTGGAYMVGIQSAAITNVVCDGTTATFTVPNHGFKASDVAAGNVVSLSGLTSLPSISATQPALTAITSTTISVACSVAISSTAETGYAGVPACLFTRAADSGAVYGGFGQSSQGLGNQTITVGPNATIRMRRFLDSSVTSNSGANAGAVWATGNYRTVVHGASPTLAEAPFCPNLRIFGCLTIDGNQGLAGRINNKNACLFYTATNLHVNDIEVYGAAGKGLFTSGVLDDYTLYQYWGKVHVHDNGSVGFHPGLRTRHCTYVDVVAHDNGQLITSNDNGTGFRLDHSQGSVLSCHAYNNKGHGVYLHNIYGCNVAGLRADGNGMHGIYVESFTASIGTGWLAIDNSQGNVGVYDDVHFNNQSNTYGVNQQTSVTGIVCGYWEPNGVTSGTPAQSRYNLYIEDGVGDIHLSKVRFLTSGLTGTYRAPLTTIVGSQPGDAAYDGNVFSFSEEGKELNTLAVTTATTTIANTSVETVLFTTSNIATDAVVSNVVGLTCTVTSNQLAFNSNLVGMPVSAVGGIGSLGTTPTITAVTDGYTCTVTAVSGTPVAGAITTFTLLNKWSGFATNQWRKGTALEFAFSGRTSNIATSGTLIFTVYAGAASASFTVATQGSSKSGSPWRWTGEIVVAAVGVAALCNISSQAYATMDSGSRAPDASSNVDTTAAPVVKVTVQWATANSGNIALCRVANLKLIST